MENIKMKNLCHLFFCILSAFIITACGSGGVSGGGNNSVDKSGVALTFDDEHIDEWYSMKDLFMQYDAKATFYVPYFYALSSDKINKLKILKDEGHEIGSHGFNHLNATYEIYDKGVSIEDYIQWEIVRSINIMTTNGLPPTSFAYPYGARTDEIDTALFEYFDYVRGANVTPDNVLIKDWDSVYYKSTSNERLIYGVGIDPSDINDIIGGLQRAAQNNEIIILYGHTLSNEKIEAILIAARDLGLTFYTVSELAN